MTLSETSIKMNRNFCPNVKEQKAQILGLITKAMPSYLAVINTVKTLFFIKHHSINKHEGVEVYHHVFLTSTVDGN
jgi:hypothetical protein